MKYILLQKGQSSEESMAREAIKPGMVLYGFCGGLFGRDSYGEKTVQEVTREHLVVIEDGYTLVSREINGDPYTWVKLIEDSNKSLKEDWE